MKYPCLMAALILGIPATGVAQYMQPPSAIQDPTDIQAPPAYTQAQLEQMLAPIALYPDQLLAQILMASTYPLEVVEAQRWLQSPKNASLKSDALAAALEEQPWDPSVKSLVPFPQILQMMDKNLQWTEQLGDAFLAQQPAVMDSVQQLRQQAETAGALKSTPQQIVSTEDDAIQIEPANPQTVYVPYYNSQTVYGAWPYPDYQPYYFPPPANFVNVNVGAFGFGVGIGILAPFWGWDSWDWHHHHIDIDDDRFSHINHGHPPIAHGVWQHNPAHRHGVPYHSAATRAQFQHASADTHRSYRGYTIATAAPGPEHAAPAPHQTSGRPVHPNPAIAMRTPEHAPAAAPAPRHVAPAMAQRPSAPLFESMPHGNEARTHAARGAASRATAPTAPKPSAPHGGGHNDKHR